MDFISSFDTESAVSANSGDAKHKDKNKKEYLQKTDNLEKHEFPTTITACMHTCTDSCLFLNIYVLFLPCHLTNYITKIGKSQIGLHSILVQAKGI